jgi:hypothetical protein
MKMNRKWSLQTVHFIEDMILFSFFPADASFQLDLARDPPMDLTKMYYLALSTLVPP